MPWCPKCKNEYYEGIKACADCGSELVDSLEEWEAAEREAREAEAQAQLAAYQEMMAQEAEAYGDDAAEAEDGEDFVGAGTRAGASARKAADNVSRGVYQDYGEKAADNKSSAYTLLGAGAAGLVAVALNFMGVVTLPFYSSMKYVVSGIMGAMFLFFFVMGIVSMKNAEKYAKKAESEKELTGELEKWFDECVSAEKIDEGLFAEEDADLSEEQKYFKRFERMKELLAERFLNLDEGYADRFLDQHYQDIFGEQ